MNKVEKIKAEIDRLQETTMDENSNFKSQYDQGIFDGLSLIDNFIDSLEQPIKRTPADIEAAMQEIEEKSKLFTEAHKDDVVSNDTIDDLEEAAHSYVDTTIECFDSEGNSCCYPAFIAGAQWQKKHLFDNRIKDCNNITEEQYNLESDFLDDFIDKHDRMPTFLDAIVHGMKLQKEREQSTIELAEDHAMLAGMDKMRQEMMKNVVLETKVMKDSDGDGIDTPYEEWLTLEDTEIPFIPDDIGLKDGDKVKLIIIREE